MSPESPVRVRFAPSPTGDLHVGGARTALFCWAFARRHGGQFLLRIEDTDQERSSEAAVVGFCDDLHWLGIGWDEGPEAHGHGGGAHGPYFQSQRLDLYRDHVERLLESGHAYRAFETPEELAAMRKAARAEGRAWKYDRTDALALSEEEIRAHVDAGKPHVVRFRVPDGTTVTVCDEVLGEVSAESSEIDDFVIMKADGFPTYHMAVVVDDALMEITHVIRGQEHLNNTLKHQLLQDALGLPRPGFAHLPLIFNPDGSKMSKRDKDKALRVAVRDRQLEGPPAGEDGAAVMDDAEWARWQSTKDAQLEHGAAARLAGALAVDLPEINVADFREAGYLPEVLVNYLALLGWHPGGDHDERFDAEFLATNFDLGRINRSAAKFDRAKLLAFSLDTIQEMSPETFHDALLAYCEVHHPEFTTALDADGFRLFASCNHERSKNLLDPVKLCRFLVVPTESIRYESTKAIRKAMVKGETNGFAHLRAIRDELANLDAWTPESIEGVIVARAEAASDGKMGKVAQPLRVAVTGTTMSPPIFDTLLLLGQPLTVERIDHCLAREAEIGATS